MAKSNDIKNKTSEELTGLLSEKRQSLRTFRFDVSGSKARNVKQGRNTRKEIARILTEVNSRSAAK